MRRRFAILTLVISAPLLLWLALPLGSGAAPLSERIAEERRAIESKKRRERDLSADIAGYSRRIGALQEDIGVLQNRQARIQADLDAKRPSSPASRRSCGPSAPAWPGSVPASPRHAPPSRAG
jgi:uncharacterized small protein (DUF1192 family)